MIRNIPGNKQLTLSLGKNSKYEIEAHSDGSLGHDRAQESLFCAKLACGIMGSGLLIIRAFDGTRFATFTKPDGQVVEAQWEMLYGVFMRGGKWQPVPPDDLRDLFATCPCCGDKIPPKPGVDYCDLWRFIEGDPASASLGGWIRRILMAALRTGWTLSRYNWFGTVGKTNKDE